MPTKNGAGFQQLQYVAVFVKQAQAKITVGFTVYEYTRKFLLLAFASAVTLSFIYTTYNKLTA